MSNPKDITAHLLSVARADAAKRKADPAEVEALLAVWSELFGPPNPRGDVPSTIPRMLESDDAETIARALAVTSRSGRVNDELGRLRYARGCLRKWRAEPSALDRRR
jgi:hypothetical protein